MFRLTTMTVLVHMKSGKTITLTGVKKASFKSDSNGFTSYSINGGGSFDIMLNQIEAVQIIQPLWRRAWTFIWR